MEDNYDFSKGKRGAVAPSANKTRITIYLDDDILEAFREQASAKGKGYQTLINDALRKALSPEPSPVTAEIVRLIVREELAGKH